MAYAGSIAAATVSIIADATDVPRTVVRALGNAGQAAAAAGEATGAAAGEAIGEGASTKLDGFLGRMTEIGKGWSEKLGVGGSIAAVGAAVGVGAAFAGGVEQAMDFQSANAKLAGQLGLSEQESARIGKAAGDLYSQNYGDSIDQVNEAMKSVIQEVGGMGQASNEQLESVSKGVINVANTFDQDLGGVSRAVGQMMKTGLAKNANEALDLITVGFQKIPNASEDLLDTFNEYGVEFQKLGLSGQDALGMINQMMAGGARNTDLAADALKEFSIRSVDGSATSVAGFQAIGLNAQEMGAKFGQGGDVAKQALGETIKALKNVKDPVMQSQAAVNLFGTQAEDLGKALYSIDPDTAVQSLGQVGGAADQMDKTINNTAQSSLATFGRQLQMTFVNILGGMVIPIITKVAQILSGVVTPVFQAVNRVIGGNTSILKALGIALAVVVGVIGTIIGITKAWSMAQAALNAVMAMNPIGLVIAGIAALVAGFLYLWNTSAGFHRFWIGLWNAISGAAAAAWAAVQGFFAGIGAALSAVVGFFVTAGQTIAAAWNATLAWFAALPGQIGAFLAALPGVVWNAFTTALLFAVNATVQGLEWVIAEIIVFPLQVAAGLATLGQILWGALSAAWTWALNATITGITTLVGWVLGLPGQIVAGLASLGGMLWGWAVGAWNAAVAGTAAGINAVVSWALGLPGQVVGAIGALGGMLWGAATAAWNGFVSGTIAGVSAVFGFVGSIPGQIVGALGNLGNLLVNAGRAIIDGLLRGLQQAVGAVFNFIGGIADKISQLKGPLPYDRVLLVPHGRAIMHGLDQGLRGEFGSVQRTLRRITHGIPDLAMPVHVTATTPGVWRTPEIAAATRTATALTRNSQITRSADRQVTVNAPITVHTIATDPRLVAAGVSNRIARLAQV